MKILMKKLNVNALINWINFTYLVLFVFMQSCSSQTKEPDFDCNVELKRNSIFPKMQDIKRILKVNDNDTKEFNLMICGLFYSKETKSYNSKMKFDTHDYGLDLEIFKRNDTLLVSGDGVIEPIAIFNKQVEPFYFWDYRVNLEISYLDKKCNDYVYVFSYKDVESPEISRIGNMELQKLYISKTRGFLKVVMRDKRNNSFWETPSWRPVCCE